MTISLSPAQLDVVNHGEGPLLVLAGPGSGKTRVLTERVRRLLTEGQGHFRVLALTFTNKAANEMRDRLAEFPNINDRAFIGTLHSFCVEVLANRGKPVGIESLPTVFESFQDRKQVLVDAAMDDPELKQLLTATRDPREQGRLVTRWLEMISDAKSKLLTPEMLTDSTDRKVYEAYDRGLRTSNALDFDDLLLLTYRLFVERPKIADFYRRQYRYICIDEAQDINEAQYQVLQALCSEEYRNVMMVGDPKQAIFVWNGADPKYLDLFERDFGATRLQLTENFRSSQAVVRAARALDPSYEIEGQLPIAGAIGLLVGEDEKQEAAKVINTIERLVNRGHDDVEGAITLERCAVLGRTRYVFSALEDDLQERGWPFYKHYSAQHESESYLVQDFELCLRVLANPRDRLHLGMLLSKWNMADASQLLNYAGDGLQGLATLRAVASNDNHRAVLSAVEALDWSPQDFKFDRAIDYLDEYASTLADEQDRALIMADTQVWRRHWHSFLRSEPGGQHSLTSFLSQVALGTTQQPRQEGLALLTVHSAKGLEFDVVIVMGMAEGTFPDYRATGRALEEEKRNAFVAITRSRRLLALSYPKSKVTPWGDVRFQKPSRYLAAMGLGDVPG